MKRILIVEDDHLIAELERDYLEASEYEVELAMDGFAGMKLLREHDYDLVILDVMLPGVSGFEICREIRKTKDIPVLLVTAKKEDVDKIRGLGLGADDYIVKPFSPAELVARVKAHIGIHEFELLLFLAENPNIAFSKETLFDRVWGLDAVGDTATVTVHVNRLREKLEDGTESPDYIETVWGMGYRFRI